MRPWSDPSWNETGDTPWRRGLRLQQGWWRESQLGMPAGSDARRKRPVLTMLPEGVGLSPNLMTPEAVTAGARAIKALRTSARPGLIDEDRLQRNLLSSQPLCFNLFGYLSTHPQALLPWLRTIAPHAASVTAVELEWAPADGALGGSAFDAYVEFTNIDESCGFLGIECKYAETLTASQRTAAAAKYLDATRPPLWRDEAATNLDSHGLRQLWYNQLLVQRLASRNDAHGVGVVLVCRADFAAVHATSTVAAQLTDPSTLVFAAIEDLVGSVIGHAEWKRAFTKRYLDFTPIQHLLPPGDPRRRLTPLELRAPPVERNSYPGG